MIPKKIFTCWLTENSQYMPGLIKKCIESQKIEGYTHHVIDLENCDRSSEYVRQALDNKNWVKASDYLRMQYLWKHGGLYLDADMEVLPGENFDDLLDCRMFTSFECAGLYANMGFGSEDDHPLLKAYLDRIDANYKGSGDLVFEPGIRTWHDICWAADKSLFKMIPTEVFFPYNHLTGKTNLTDATKVFHHFMKSWVTPFFKEKLKNDHVKKNDMKNIFTKYYLNNEWGDRESVSGTGSTVENTSNIRRLIPEIISMYNIKVILDAPCGDYNWFRMINRNIKYIGGDIVDELIERNNRLFRNENTEFITLDVTKDKLPNADLLLCRDCWPHFSNADIQKAIENFLSSDIKYLLTTNCGDKENEDIETGGFRLLNLSAKPFSFSRPLYTIHDWTWSNFPPKTLVLYDKEAIKKR